MRDTQTLAVTVAKGLHHLGLGQRYLQTVADELELEGAGAPQEVEADEAVAPVADQPAAETPKAEDKEPEPKKRTRKRAAPKSEPKAETDEPAQPTVTKAEFLKACTALAEKLSAKLAEEQEADLGDEEEASAIRNQAKIAVRKTVFKPFGVNSLVELSEDKYAEAMDKVQEALAA